MNLDETISSGRASVSHSDNGGTVSVGFGSQYVLNENSTVELFSVIWM